jgi:signal transduction histidine kinase
VQAHRGMIFCDSEPGTGTTFTIYVPARFSAEEAV